MDLTPFTTMRNTTWEASNKKRYQLVKWCMTFLLSCWPISGRQAKVARIYIIEMETTMTCGIAMANQVEETGPI